MEECNENFVDNNIPLKLKEIFYNTAIKPVLLYNMECWTIKGYHLERWV